jgi:hypothetical protein
VLVVLAGVISLCWTLRLALELLLLLWHSSSTSDGAQLGSSGSDSRCFAALLLGF